MSHKVYLIDGSGYIFRAFYAVAPLSTKSGFPTNALFGFSRMLIKLMQESDSEHMVMVFDAGRETFRNKLYSEYKANREACPPDLAVQFPFFREISRALGLLMLEQPGYEADDVIGTLARRLESAGAEVVIISGDKDLMQLVGGPISIWDTLKDKQIGVKEVKEKFGVSPDKVVEVLGLIGDSSDNIPGLQGVGPKTALQLIEKFGTVEGVLSSVEQILDDSSIRNRKKIVDQILASTDIVRLSRKLVEIDTQVPLELPVNVAEPLGATRLLSTLEAADLLELTRRRGPNADHLASLSQKLEFSALFGDVPALVPSGSGDEFDWEVKTIFKNGFDDWLRQLEVQPEFALDLETTSLDPLSATIVGASFCWDDKTAYYVPLSHAPEALVNVPGCEQIELNDFLTKLKPVLASVEHKKIGQNLKYDLSVLLKAGVEVLGVEFDTMVAAWLINSDAQSYNLTVLAREYLKLPTIEFDEVVGDKGNFSEVDVLKASRYAGQDALYAWRLKQIFQKKLLELGLTELLLGIEMPLVRILAQMEMRGVKLDCALLASMSEEFGSQLEALKIKLYELAGSEFNINSPKQLSEILFDKLGISTKGLKRTKTGTSTDSSVLEKLRRVHPLPDFILQYRMLHKLKSTYVDTLPLQVSPISGRLHSRFNQALTATGRLSSSDPNLQNIPIQTTEGRRIRSAFIAEPGNVLISADYSQIELRLLAHMSGDETLVQGFHQGIDIHAKTAREILGLEINEEITSEQRRMGKTINFGIVYGMSGFRLAGELEIPVSIGNSYIENYFNRYPGVRAFFDRLEHEAETNGYVTTLFGRRRTIAAIDTSGRDRGFVMRAALNAPLQGSAADIIKIAMAKVVDKIEKTKSPVKMIMQIHDELVFECPESAKEDAVALIVEGMEGAAELRVPLKVDAGWGRHWQDAHS